MSQELFTKHELKVHGPSNRLILVLGFSLLKNIISDVKFHFFFCQKLICFYGFNNLLSTVYPTIQFTSL